MVGSLPIHAFRSSYVRTSGIRVNPPLPSSNSGVQTYQRSVARQVNGSSGTNMDGILSQAKDMQHVRVSTYKPIYNPIRVNGYSDKLKRITTHFGGTGPKGIFLDARG